MSSQYLGYPNEFAKEPMPTQQMVDLCKEHTLYTWSAGNAVNPLPIARAEGVYLYSPQRRRTSILASSASTRRRRAPSLLR